MEGNQTLKRHSEEYRGIRFPTLKMAFANTMNSFHCCTMNTRRVVLASFFLNDNHICIKPICVRLGVNYLSETCKNVGH